MISDDDVVEPPPEPAAEAEAPPPSTTAAQPVKRRFPALVAVLAVLLVAAVVVAVLQTTASSDAQDERDALAATDGDERDARLVAAQFAEAFLAYDYTDAEATDAAVLALVTDDYASTYQANRLEGVNQLFTNTQLISSGAAQDVYLSTIADGAVKAVVVVDLDMNVGGEARTVDDFTLLLDLRQQDGEWKVDGASLPRTRILGPDGQPLDGGAPAETTTTTTAVP